MASVLRRSRLACLALWVALSAAACTSDPGGYLFVGINRSEREVIVWLDRDPSIVRLPAQTRAGIASGWGYRDGATLTVLDDSCSVLGSRPVAGPSSVLIIGADATLTTDPDRRAFDRATERPVSAERDPTCRPFRVSNRTTQDVSFRFGDLPASAVFVPACEDVVSDPEHSPDHPTPPPTAIEVRYNVAAGLRELMPTFTITSEQVWTGILASAPPCEGLGPTSTRPT